MISDNVEISWEGTEGSVSGDVYYITDFSEFFGSSTEKEGHFFPISLDPKLQGKTLTVSGRTSGDRQVEIDGDLLLIVRLENLEGDTITVKDGENVLFTIDFSGLTRIECPIGEVAFNKNKSNYGGFGDTSVFYDNIELAWTGTKATVTGTLNYVKKDDHPEFGKMSTDGYYFAFALDPWFSGKDITFTGNSTKTSPDTDWVITVDAANKSKGLSVKYNSTVIANFDLTGVTLGEQGN